MKIVDGRSAREIRREGACRSFLPRLLLLCGCMLPGFSSNSAPPPGNFEAAQQGAELAARVRSQRPLPEATASLMVRDSKGLRKSMAVRLRTSEVSPRSWQVIYTATPRDHEPPSTTNTWEQLIVLQSPDHPPKHERTVVYGNPPSTNRMELTGNRAGIPFAGSDFFLSDLAMDFLHWPEQHLLRHEIKKSRSCRVLESINPDADAAAYARVVSWADIETGNLVRVEAFDSKGKKVKDFTVSKVARVNGKWQLREIRIYDYRNDSTTTLEFEIDVDAE